MPPMTDHREQARLCQLREMGAGGLRRDLRRTGKLARGQGTAIEKRREHGRSGRLSDQCRDLGDDRACNHFRCLIPESVLVTKVIGIEVYSASDPMIKRIGDDAISFAAE